MKKVNENLEVSWNTYPLTKPEIEEDMIKDYLVRGTSSITGTQHAFIFSWINCPKEKLYGWFYGGNEVYPGRILKEPFEYCEIDKL